MVIKPAGKIVILILFGVLAFFTYKYLKNPDKADDTTITNGSGGSSSERGTTGDNTGTEQNGNNNRSSGSTAANDDSRAFNYHPEKPVNGTLRGVVEVGAAGFNSFVINMDREKNWEIVSKDFGESLAYEGLMTAEDVRLGLKKYLSGMFNKGVSSKNMHFVISSGAQKVEKTHLIANELKKMGYVVNTVNADQEGKYALKATIPPSFTESSFMVDIGSGNTKLSWYDGGNLKALEMPGAKYYEHNTSDDAVYNEVKSKVSAIPQNKRNVCFIIGGVPFTLAKQSRKGEERYTVLKDPGSYTAEDKKSASGINIYKGIVDGTKCDTFVFDWDANFTIGFLLTLP